MSVPKPGRFNPGAPCRDGWTTKRIMIKLPGLKNIITKKKVRLGREIVRNSEKMMPEQKALSTGRDPEIRTP